MSDRQKMAVHWSFWLIAALTLIWNLLGAMNFVWQMNPDAVAAMPDSHRAIIDVRPAWATAAFALAVFGGALGCVLLLLRKSAAVYLFIASLLGVLVQVIPHAGMVGSTIHDPAEIVMMIVMPFVVAGFLLAYAVWAKGSGWIA